MMIDPNDVEGDRVFHAGQLYDASVSPGNRSRGPDPRVRWAPLPHRLHESLNLLDGCVAEDPLAEVGDVTPGPECAHHRAGTVRDDFG